MRAPLQRGFLTASGWGPEVRGSLEAFVAEAPPGSVAAFDFDQTLMFGDVSETLLTLLAEERGVDLVGEYEAGCATDMRRAYVDLVYTLVGGRTERQARELAERALHEGARRGILAVREPMRELVWAMQRSGWEVWVVTASAEVLVQVAAERIGIHPHRVLGMRAEVGEDARFRDRIVEPIPYREGKLELLRREIGRDPSFAAGDSRSDAWLLHAAERALLVDRGDDALRAEMAARGAWIRPTAALR